MVFYCLFLLLDWIEDPYNKMKLSYYLFMTLVIFVISFLLPYINYLKEKELIKNKLLELKK